MTVSPLYRSSTTSLSRPSTRLRENCNDEFQKLDRYAIQGTDSFDGFLSVMTQTGKKNSCDAQLQSLEGSCRRSCVAELNSDPYVP